MDKISSKHFIFVMLGLSLISLENYNTILLRTSGRDAWISIILASILFILFYTFIFKVGAKNNSFNYKDIYFSSFGKYLGGLLIFFLVLTLYFTLIESCSIEANSLHTNFMYGTPTWFFILLFTLPALYSIRKGKIALIILTLTGITLILISYILIIALSVKYKNYNNLLPVLVNGFTKDMFNTLIKALGAYGFVFLSLPFIEDVIDDDKLKWSIPIGLFIIILIEIVNSTGIIANFGSKRAASISYPGIIETQQISYLNFFESGDFFIMLQIVIGWFIKYLLVFYSLIRIIKELNLNSKYVSFIITILVTLPSFYISADINKLFYLLNYFTYVCFVNLVLIPIVVFTIYYTKLDYKKNL